MSPGTIHISLALFKEVLEFLRNLVEHHGLDDSPATKEDAQRLLDKLRNAR